ncbi:hypothetical protein B0H67DRAFT_589155 [Lasiosphaeris hirsuta]|uniref:Secreted protein n=1 Tax=Lasiosphaeris hirsuta TaxID=260670 RepID=A0AA40A2E7_9PEZI|nr:hypothetical protein B0H67DRAFT_589155 [Lasiosphaeris hirsuta]
MTKPPRLFLEILSLLLFPGTTHCYPYSALLVVILSFFNMVNASLKWGCPSYTTAVSSEIRILVQANRIDAMRHPYLGMNASGYNSTDT